MTDRERVMILLLGWANHRLTTAEVDAALADHGDPAAAARSLIHRKHHPLPLPPA